jgi:hypothetical protein
MADTRHHRDPPQPQTISYRVVVEKDGEVSACDVLSDNEAEVARKSCARSLGMVFAPVLGCEGAPVRTATTVTFKTEQTRLSD